MKTLRWKRLLVVLLLAFGAVAVLTPVFCAILGTSTRKTSHLILQISFLLALAITGRGRRTSWLDEAGLRTARPGRLWLTGFLIGAATLGAYNLLLLAIGQRVGEATWDMALVLYAAKYVPFSFTVGVLEDVSFFGFLYVICGARVAPCAAIYSVTHFIHIDKDKTFSDRTLTQGVEAIAEMGRSLLRCLDAPAEAIGLFAVGLVLCNLRRASGTVWISMGVHGGWFYAKKMARKLSDDVDGPAEWLWGSDHYYDGVLGWITVLATGAIATTWWLRSGQHEPGESQHGDSGRDPEP